MLRLENITYLFSGSSRSGVRNLSFSARPGERIAVMGANGSGKTTLARIIAGLLKPQTGQLHLPDPGSSTPVGMVFQNPDNQIVALTVEKEIAFALENLGVPNREMAGRISAILEVFNIGHLRKRLTSELSGGEKQRVAIAGIMVLEPSVLVLDEPETFQDVAGRQALLSILDDTQNERPETIIVHITQEPELARTCRRLIVLDEGRLVADEPADSILTDADRCRKLKILASHTSPPLTSEDGRRTHKRLIERVEGESIQFGYDSRTPVLEELSFAFKSGEALAVVGPSGSGKSTLALLLARLAKPTSGSLQFFDAPGHSIPDAAMRGRTVAVFQQPERQFFLGSCTEEIEFGPRNLGRTITHYQVERLLEQVGLQPQLFFDRDPFTLSGGEKRRLAFAVALALLPDLVIFDEPTCALDADGIDRFLRVVRLLKERGTLVAVITHSGALLRRVADLVLILEPGEAPRTMPADRFLVSSNVEQFVTNLY